MTGAPPVDEQCARPECHNRRVTPHPHSLCRDHYPGTPPTVKLTAGHHEYEDRPDGEAVAIANSGAPSEEEGSDDAGGFSLADAMGPTDGLADPTPRETSATTSVGGGSSLGLPESALPIAQLDALPPAKRRRAARRRGCEWPTTDEARNRLFDTLATVMREADDRVVDAPTSLGKTHTVAATRWGARDDLTGERPVVHLLQTRDARDEAVEIAETHGGEYFVLRSRHEACPVAAGAYDPEAVADDSNRDPITVDGQPASEWIRERCEGRGIHFSAVHRRLEDAVDQGRALPCCVDGECDAITQWDEYREGNHPLVIATHNFAYAPGLRMQNNLVVDEEPDYLQDLSTDRARRAIGAYLREVDAPVTTWEAFIQLAGHDGHSDDAAHERDALADALDREPDREWSFQNADAHTLAPALARAIFHAESRPNGRRVGKTLYEPPRLDGGARDDEDWNREWVTVVLDEANDVRSVRAVPDFRAARSVIGLDAHPALPTWQVNTVPWIQRAQVLNPEERRLWRRYERGLRVVQVGDATRPLASGEYFDWDGCQALVEHLRDTYGDDFRTAITTKAVEDRLATIMDHAGVHSADTMHYGEEKSRNDFATEDVGFVNGSLDPGDEHVLDILAELDCEARPERSEGACEHCKGEGCHECAGTGQKRAHGRGFEGPDADTAQAILASVRENHVAQAAGRYARCPEDPDDTATVFVRTDALPPGFADVQVPGVVWTYGRKQRAVVEVLREAAEPLSARTIAQRADCTKEHVRETLQQLADEDGVDDVQAIEGAGEYGATLYATDGVPNSGVVDLEAGIANSPVWDSYTWELAIRPGEASKAVATGSARGDVTASPAAQQALSSFTGGDSPPDDAG